MSLDEPLLPKLPDPANGGETARLYAFVAPRRRAVVFRRGPTKQVRLLLWELDGDRIVGGQ